MRDLTADGTVAVDFDQSGTVVGIELVDGRSQDSLIARSFAQQNGLAFPTVFAPAHFPAQPS